MWERRSHAFPPHYTTGYDSLPTFASKYTHAQNVLTVTNRVERAQSIVIIKHKYMLMCNHKIRIKIMRCLRNSTVRREIGQLRRRQCITTSEERGLNENAFWRFMRRTEKRKIDQRTAIDLFHIVRY